LNVSYRLAKSRTWRKFKLFSGVFGSSDEVLGALESGIDVERRISDIYLSCRTSEEVATAFDTLQSECSQQIQQRIESTRVSVLEHFDDDVAQRLKLRQSTTSQSLSQWEQWLFALSQVELSNRAYFHLDDCSFDVMAGSDVQGGRYILNWKEAERRNGIFYRVDHPLAEQLISAAKERSLPPSILTFDYSSYGKKVSALEPLVGRNGVLELALLRVESLDAEEHLIFTGRVDGELIDDEVCRKLFQLPVSAAPDGDAIGIDFALLRASQVEEILASMEASDRKHFDEYCDKLDRWSEDLKEDLERKIKEKERELKEAKRYLKREAQTLEEKIGAQRTIKKLESERHRMRRELFIEQDRIEEEREGLIARTESRLKAKSHTEVLFQVKWMVI
jgi:hypothetical protein